MQEQYDCDFFHIILKKIISCIYNLYNNDWSVTGLEAIELIKRKNETNENEISDCMNNFNQFL